MKMIFDEFYFLAHQNFKFYFMWDYWYWTPSYDDSWKRYFSI